MSVMVRRGPVALLTCLLALVLSAAPAAALDGADELHDGWFTISDEAGNELLLTGLQVEVGDGFIAADNREYKVVAVTGRTAVARLVGQVSLALSAEEEALLALPSRPWYAGLFDWTLARRVAEQEDLRREPLQVRPRKDRVAIYHTHSGESYEPSDGTDQKEGRGGIYQVGTALRQALEEHNFEVIHDQTNHLPHDAAAYSRSRRTVLQLLTRQQPAAIFDLHRDTTPPAAYHAKIKGQDVAQVMLVVGRQNPNMQTSLAWAKKLKAAADAKYPGLVRGIFFARGHYNQDLYPRLALLEMGAHQSPREHAEAGARLLAGIVPDVVGAAAGGGPARGGGGAAEGRSGMRQSIWLVVLAVVGAGVFLVLSSGGFAQAGKRLGNMRQEVAGFWGRNRRRSGPQ